MNAETPAAPAVAVAYVRVSKGEQTLSPDAQREACERWAAARGVELAGVFVDIGRSGSLPAAERDGLMAAIDAVGKLDAKSLIVAKRDRLGRDVVECALTERLAGRAGARVVSAAGEGTDTDPDDPAGLLMRRLVDAFAEYELAVIRARTKTALAVKKARGERVGSVPYGYRLNPDGKTLDPVKRELAAVAAARELRSAGVSYRKIAAELEARGFVARTGKRFAPAQVRRFAA